MISIWMTIVMCCLVHLTNADVVVFVHGLAGFGPNELLGVGYWGFPGVFSGQDYLQTLRNKGHTVIYASVGPVSSNWDRACELYAQIKGTKVDYGQAHSSKTGHSRYGKDYTGKGFYQYWDGSHKIHFVGHSMGGNTIRMLEYLLQNGSPAEVAATGSGTSLLFQTSKPGGNNWIQSMFTIATPHDGSTLHTKLGGTLVTFIKNLISVFAGVAGLVPSASDWFYDLSLAQFGLARNSGEGFWSYYNRVFQSSIWASNFKDLASWDLSPQAAREFNAITKLTYPGTYYFSASTQQTHSCWFWDQCGDLDIEALMGISANLIGDMDGVCDSGGYCFGDSWEASDGLVPTRSSASPQVGIANYVDPLNWDSSAKSFSQGRWYSKRYYRDHVQIIGFRLNILTWNAADGLYDSIADTIGKIPASASSSGSGDSLVVDDNVVSPVGAIAGGILGGVAAVVILSVGIVQYRRRRHSKRMVTAFSSSAAATASFSPRKFTKKQIERGSITLETDIEAANPVFNVREGTSAASVAPPARSDV